MTYNVKTFGAVGDGVANDTSAIQSAINYASAQGGGTVLFPAGTYRITAALTVAKHGVVLEGETAHGSIIKLSTANQDGVVFYRSGGDLSNAGVRRLFFLSEGITARHIISLRDTYAFLAEDIKIWGPCLHAIDMRRGTYSYNTVFRQIIIGDGPVVGIAIGINGTGEIANVELSSVYIGQATDAGVWVRQCGGLKWSGGEVLGAGRGLVIETPSGLYTKGAQISNVFFDTCVNENVLIKNLDTGRVSGISFDNCSFNHSQNADGCIVQGADGSGGSRMHNIRFVGCEFLINKRKGLFTAQAKHIDLVGCHFVTNGSTTNRQANIEFGGGTSGARVIGGFTGINDEFTSPASSYGIKVDNSTNVRILGVEFRNNVDGPVQLTNAGDVRIADCIGLTTANKSSFEITSSAIQVPHGLSFTPDKADIFLSPVTDPGSTNYWVESANATHFTVRRSNGSANAWIGWRASVHST